MKKYLWPFITFWLLNSILLYLAAWFYPFYFVLGNKSMSAVWAAVVSGFTWTLITWIASPILSAWLKTKSVLIMFGFYFLANFVALWITARLAPIFGFGVTSFVWLVFLAILANIFQYAIWKIAKFKQVMK